jgi:hypothetical protein
VTGAALQRSTVSSWKRPERQPSSRTKAVEVTPVFAQVDDAVPISWRIAGAGLNLEARVIDTSRQDGFGQPATMSLVEVTGTRAGQNVDGTGTLFLSSDDLS